MVRRKVVIVEDSEGVANSLALAFEGILHLDAIVTADPYSAIRIFQAAGTDISILVTDLHLPHLDGFELIREIRMLDGYRNLPAIMITADELCATSQEPGIQEPNVIFRKPFSVKEVCRVLEGLLR